MLGVGTSIRSHAVRIHVSTDNLKDVQRKKDELIIVANIGYFTGLVCIFDKALQVDIKVDRPMHGLAIEHLKIKGNPKKVFDKSEEK